MLIQIPFSGFYESIHNSQIDNELNYGVFTDHATGCTNNDKLSQLAFDSMDWRKLFIEYAQEYTKYFAHKFNLNIEFESLSSPKKYNFSTDRIFVTIPDSDLLKMYAEVDRSLFAENIKKTFTSYDGFSSFYSNDIHDWSTNPLEFDHNEATCLFESWLIDKHEFDLNDFEWCFIESASSNGFYYELIYKHCEDKRLFTVCDYLNKRAERVTK